MMLMVCPKCSSTHEVDTSKPGWSDTCIECQPRVRTFVPSPFYVAGVLWRIGRTLYVIFDMIVLLTLLGFGRILNWLGLIQFGWIVIHWWRGDRRR